MSHVLVTHAKTQRYRSATSSRKTPNRIPISQNITEVGKHVV